HGVDVQRLAERGRDLPGLVELRGDTQECRSSPVRKVGKLCERYLGQLEIGAALVLVLAALLADDDERVPVALARDVCVAASRARVDDPDDVLVLPGSRQQLVKHAQA